MVVGAASYFRLGVDRFPSVDLPVVQIRTTLPGGAPEDVETEITEEIEEAVNSVEGISELRSVSGSGTSIVNVTFDLDRDIDGAAQDVRDRVQTVLRKLPVGTDPPIITKQDNDSSPVMTRRALGEPLGPRAHRDRRQATCACSSSARAGSARCASSAGRSARSRSGSDADRLAAYGIPITRRARRDRASRTSTSRAAT